MPAAPVYQILSGLKNNDMERNLLITIILSVCYCFGQPGGAISGSGVNPYPSIGQIPVPMGYRRVAAPRGDFADWLRAVPLKKDRTVYLFDGRRKQNQDAQWAVLDVSVGSEDLQQCADAVMRLRAEYLYAGKDYTDIDFYTEQGTRLNFYEWANGGRVRLAGNRLINYTCAGSPDPGRRNFTEYLRTVFSYCGTLSLEKQLIPVDHLGDMRIGDVLIRGGSPGHAMLVADMAEDGKGHRVYLLAQSYMPAQDIHIVKNPVDAGISPWYRVDEAAGSGGTIYTPEWTFYISQLRTWPRLKGR
jgi:hypothetical protein